MEYFLPIKFIEMSLTAVSVTNGLTSFGQNIHRRQFPEKQLTNKKQQNYCAHATRQHHRNERAQCSPCTAAAKRSSCLAVIVAQESAETFVTLDDTSQPRTTAVSVASNFWTIRGHIHFQACLSRNRPAIF